MLYVQMGNEMVLPGQDTFIQQGKHTVNSSAYQILQCIQCIHKQIFIEVNNHGFTALM